MRRRVHVQSRAANLLGGEMGKSRREFLGTASAGLIAALTTADASPRGVVDAAEQDPTKNGPAGAPSAYGAEAAESWRVTMASLYERRVGPRKMPIEESMAPYSQWNPVLPGQKAGPTRDVF